MVKNSWCLMPLSTILQLSNIKAVGEWCSDGFCSRIVILQWTFKLKKIFLFIYRIYNPNSYQHNVFQHRLKFSNIYKLTLCYSGGWIISRMIWLKNYSFGIKQ
jgi:hypothetical protein